MSRESDELGEEQFYEGLLGRGEGDPDVYGYPGQPEPTEEELTAINANFGTIQPF